MLVYLVLFFFVLCSAYTCEIKGRNQYRSFFFLFIYLFIILFFALEWRMGVDNSAYEEYYVDIPQFSDLNVSDLVFGSQFQPLWIIYISFIKQLFGESYIIFHIVQALIVNTIILNFFRKNTRYYFTAIFLYVFSLNFLYFNLDIQRESLAVCCFLLSIKSLEEKAYVRYYLICFVAIWFHLFAVVLFFIPPIIYFFRKVNSLDSFYLWGILSSLVFVSFFDYMMRAFLPGMAAVDSLMNQASYYYEADKNFGHLAAVALIDVLPPICFLIIRFRLQMNHRDVFTLLTYIYIVLIFCSPFISGLSRIKNYMVLPYYVFIVDTLYYARRVHRFKQLILIGLITMFLMVGFDYSRPLGGGPRAKITYYIPYRSVFAK